MTRSNPWPQLAPYWLIPILLSLVLFVLSRYLPRKGDNRWLLTMAALSILIGGLGWATLLTYLLFFTEF